MGISTKGESREVGATFDVDGTRGDILLKVAHVVGA